MDGGMAPIHALSVPVAAAISPICCFLMNFNATFSSHLTLLAIVSVSNHHASVLMSPPSIRFDPCLAPMMRRLPPRRYIDLL